MEQEKLNLKKIKELIVRYLADEITEEEYEILSELISSDQKIKKLFDEMVSIWQYAGTLKSFSEEEARKIFKRLELRITKSIKPIKEQEIGISGAGFVNLSRKWLSLAAAILLAFLTGGITYYLIFSGKQQLHFNPETSQVSTPYGTRSELVLSDGTMVWLNAGSILTYNENYNIQSREVNLTGEAYFKVAKDQKKPFIVKSGGLQIKALGTVFNVKAYPDESTLTATLIEGRIVVEGKSIEDGTFSYSLQPKQTITFLKTKTEMSSFQPNETNKIPIVRIEKKAPRIIGNIDLENNVNTVLYTSWKDRRWVIEREPFSRLAVMLERRYDIRIVFEPSEIEGISFSGTIENETLEQVLNVLQLSAPIKYQFGKGEVRITIDKNRLQKFKSITTGN